MTVTETTTETLPQDTELEEHAAGETADDVVEEVLVEEISIDGMCGVY